MSDEERRFIFAHIACQYLFGLNTHIDTPGLGLESLKKIAVLHDPMQLHNVACMNLKCTLNVALDALKKSNYEELYVPKNRLKTEVHIFRTIYHAKFEYENFVTFIAEKIVSYILQLCTILNQYERLCELSNKCVLSKVSRNVRFTRANKECMEKLSKSLENLNTKLRTGINGVLDNIVDVERIFQDSSLYNTRHIAGAKKFLSDVLNMECDYKQSFKDTHNADCHIELSYYKLKIQVEKWCLEYTFDIDNILRLEFSDFL